ncbi:MAG: hypothetical protein ACKV2O_14705 [Acidimicrobiales bacterium]
MAGELITGDWQLEYRGLLTGGDAVIAFVGCEGLVDMPAVRSADQILLHRHGAHPGADFTDSRAVVLTYELATANAADLAHHVEDLQRAYRPGGDEEPLVFKIPGVAGGEKARLYCRPRRREMPIGMAWYHRIPVATIELVASDPLL